MPTFIHDGITFNYFDSGRGLPFVFQHGLGGDLKQPTGLYTPVDGVHLLSFDFRAHGATRPLGKIEGISFASFADDLIALLDELSIRKAIVGGISMGAGVALNCAIRYPERIKALILSRPAWMFDACPPNLAIYDMIASLIRQHESADAIAIFTQTEAYKRILGQSPDAAQSLVGQFQGLGAQESVVKLERMPHDAPTRSIQEIKSILAPTLVLSSRQDPIHPFEYGVQLAELIPGTQFMELTPKSVDIKQHAHDVQNAITVFLDTVVDKMNPGG